MVVAVAAPDLDFVNAGGALAGYSCRRDLAAIRIIGSARVSHESDVPREHAGNVAGEPSTHHVEKPDSLSPFRDASQLVIIHFTAT